MSKKEKVELVLITLAIAVGIIVAYPFLVTLMVMGGAK